MQRPDPRLASISGTTVPAADAAARDAAGFVLVTLVIVLMPLVLIVGAFTLTMTAKGKRLQAELAQEKALQAAEAAIDESVYRAEVGTLTSGASFTRVLGGGLSFVVDPLFLGSDGDDNDGDTVIDEADENVFRLIVTGTYRDVTRRFAAYLGPVSWLPPIESAVTVQNPALDVQLAGAALVSGFDRHMDGAAGDAVDDRPALSITPPGTTTDLLATLTAAEQSTLAGPGGPPSLGVSAAIDVNALAVTVQNSANVVLTNAVYGSYDFGDGQLGAANITYRSGNVKFTGNSHGAGILVVTGDLEIAGNFRFDGVIIVLGALKTSVGTTELYGGIVLGPASTLLSTSGTARVWRSAEAIALANSRSGRYVAFNGWQELSR